MSITYKPTEPLEVGIGESMPAEFIKEAERSRARTVSLTDEIKRLKTENAKLRNLVQMFSKFERNGCHECPMEEDCKVLCVYDGDCGMAVEIDEEMRELGIEAD